MGSQGFLSGDSRSGASFPTYWILLETISVETTSSLFLCAEASEEPQHPRQLVMTCHDLSTSSSTSGWCLTDSFVWCLMCLVWLMTVDALACRGMLSGLQDPHDGFPLAVCSGLMGLYGLSYVVT